jgi:hypothetical protein
MSLFSKDELGKCKNIIGLEIERKKDIHNRAQQLLLEGKEPFFTPTKVLCSLFHKFTDKVISC